METFLNNGIAFIVWFQGLGEWLIAPMKIFSSLGSEEFFLVALPLIYWCVDAASGARIGVIVLVTGGLNQIFKLFLHGPRPYWYSPQVKALAAESSFGVPSGHAQIATGLWGMMAAQLRRRWAWYVALFIILSIGVSRLYLGVHFPHDVLLGWLIGGLVLWAFLARWDAVAAWAGRKSLGQQVGLAFGASMLLVVFGMIGLGTLRGWVLPADWLQNAARAGSAGLPAPASLSGTITQTALLFGMLSGLAWTRSRGGYHAGGSFARRALRLLPGLAGVLVLYLGLSAIFPPGDTFFPLLLRYVRYAFIAFWVTGGAPWLFIKLKLASPAVDRN